jgi:competence protein ComEC
LGGDASAILALVGWIAGVAAAYAGPGLIADGVAWPPPWTWLALALVTLASWGLAQAVAARRAAGVVLPVVMLALGLARGSSAVHHAGPETVDGYIGSLVRIEGGVESVSAPLSGAGGSTASQQQRFRLSADHLESSGSAHAVRGLVLVQAHAQPQVWPGQRLSLSGRLARVPRLGPGGAAGYADRLERQGVEAVLSAGGIVPLTPPPRVSIARLIEVLRQALVHACREALPEPEASIVLGEVAGIRGRLPPVVDSDLVNSGLVHILAISGIKVAIIAGVLQMLTVALGGRRAALGAIGGIGLYTLVGGASASALRSAMMGSLALVARSLRRDPEVLRSLLLAAGLMLAWRPALVTDLSFQYSFLGVLGIHLFAEPCGRSLGALPQPFREALAVTIAAQLATLPLTAHYFHVIPMLAPVANALVLPTLPLSIVGGLLLGVVAAVGRALAWSLPAGSTLIIPIQVALATLLLWLARLALATAHLAAHLPGAVVGTPNFGGGPTSAYYAGLSLSVAAAHRWRAPAAVGLGVCAGVLVLLLLGRPDGRMHASFLSAGGGPAVLIVAPDGATMLIDGGSQSQALAGALDSALPAGLPVPGRKRIGALVLTGGTHSEAGGLAALDGFTISLVVVPERLGGGAADQVVSAAARRGAAIALARPGDELRWHGLAVQLLPATSKSSAAIISYGAERIAIVEASGVEPPVLPPGDYAVVDIGQGTVSPDLQGLGIRLVFAQDHAGRPVARALHQVYGDALWQSSRDGALDVICDERRCRW